MIASHKLFRGEIITARNFQKLQFSRAEYEKYGNLVDHDILREMKEYNGARQYGDVIVRLKKSSLASRTTWTDGDSLGKKYQPSLVTNPKAESYDSENFFPKSSTQTDDMAEFRNKNILSYLELQYHSHVGVRDVESLSIKEDVKKNKKLLDELNEWKKLGVKIHYSPDRGNTLK